MITLELIRKYFPPNVRHNSLYYKYMLKEYLQLLILDHLSNSAHIQKLSFIGGTHLRLLLGINRFSEDLDFDCKEFGQNEFRQMTDDIAGYLRLNGFRVEAKESESDRLSAFRCNYYFPEFMFEMGLSGHREARFLIKVEAQDQQVDYHSEIHFIKGCGFFFPFPAPAANVICSMKILAMLNRQKGRDFYDVMFLLAQTQPDYAFLSQKTGISNLHELKARITDSIRKVDLKEKRKDFEHLLINKEDSRKILYFKEFINEL